MKLSLLLGIFFSLSAQTIPELKIIGKAVLLKTEFVSSKIRDVNGEECAAIRIDSDLSGFSFESNNGIVKLDKKEGRSLVYLSTTERVLTLFRKGYKPFRLIFSELGITLKAKEIWAVEVSADKENKLLPVNILFHPAPDSLFIASFFSASHIFAIQIAHYRKGNIANSTICRNIKVHTFALLHV